ncbi:MAG: hypothetical protein KBG75_09810 [Pseudomonadales bacterium]|nr:hypothetical protein [Pseudomonadales bacterium]
MNDDHDIPLLIDIVEPAAPAEPAPGATQPAPDVPAALAIEATFLIDELVDEYLPRIEARLRERLETRLRELSAATLREKPQR